MSKIADALAVAANVAAGAVLAPIAGPIVGSVAATVAGGVSLLSLKLQWDTQRRVQVLLDLIGNRLDALPITIVECPEFRHAFDSARRLSEVTFHDEKIRLFADLFVNYSNHLDAVAVDEYDESLQILRELSIREFKSLVVIHNHGSKVTIGQDYGTSLLDRLVSEAGVPLEHIPGLLERLRRTGLYQPMVGSNRPFWKHKGLSLDFDFGVTTANFVSLLGLLGLRDSDCQVQPGESPTDPLNARIDAPDDESWPSLPDRGEAIRVIFSRDIPKDAVRAFVSEFQQRHNVFGRAARQVERGKINRAHTDYYRYQFDLHVSSAEMETILADIHGSNEVDTVCCFRENESKDALYEDFSRRMERDMEKAIRSL